MIGTLDRLLESGIASLIDAQSIDIQCIPNLLASGEADVVLPRVVVKSESRDDPDFQPTPDGIYGVCICSVVVSSISEATSPTSSTEMEEMDSAVDDVIDNPLLAELLTAGELKVYGVVPGDYDHQIFGNQIIRTRLADIWARLEAPADIIVDSPELPLLSTAGLSPYIDLDATTLVLADGAAVTAWTNGGSIPGNAVVGNAPLYVLSTLIAKPAVRFNGIANFLQIANNALMKVNSGVTVIAVLESDANAVGQRIASRAGTSGSSDVNTSGFAIENCVGVLQAGAFATTVPAGLSLTSWSIFSSRWSGGTLQAWRNGSATSFAGCTIPSGALDAGNNVSGTNNDVTESSAAIAFGKRLVGTGLFWPGDMGRIVVIFGDCPQRVIRWIEGVLARQFGLRALLPVDHPYKSAVPATPPAETKWISQPAYSGFPTHRWLGSPDIVTAGDGSLVVSHDYFGPANTPPVGMAAFTSAAIRSTDGGLTWGAPVLTTTMWWPTSWRHPTDGHLYRMGTNGVGGALTIHRSTDNGITWSVPVTLLAGGGASTSWHMGGGMKPLYVNGFILKALERYSSAALAWPPTRVRIIFANATSDLLNPASWISSNELTDLTGILEFGLVLDPSSNIKVFGRTPSPNTCLRLSATLNTGTPAVTISSDGNFTLLGAHVNFAIHRHTNGFYYALVNNTTDATVRNVLSLIRSSDLSTWTVIKTVLSDDLYTGAYSEVKTGWQYCTPLVTDPTMVLDGSIIYFVCRTGYDGANDYHNSNRITFHSTTLL